MQQGRGRRSPRHRAPKGFRPLKWVLGIVIVFTIYQFFSKPSGLWQMRDLYLKNIQMEQKVDSLKQAKVLLEKEKELLSRDSAYIEKTARGELGMAKPGEKVFRFVK